MCHISFVSDADKASMNQMLNIMSEECEHNSDGYGIFNKRNIFRSIEKEMKIDNETKSMFKGGWVIGHNRFGTKGEATLENTHPFVTESFMFCHNGVISNCEELEKDIGKVEVDSQVIGLLLEKYKALPFEKMIQEAAKRIEGYFSVFLYDKRSSKLYYFKHNANFSFASVKYKGKKYIYGFTSAEHFKDLFNTHKKGVITFAGKKIKPLEIESDAVYEIGKKLIKVCDFTAKVKEYSSCYYGQTYGFVNKYGDDKPELINELTSMKAEIALFIKRAYGTWIKFKKNQSGYYIKCKNQAAMDFINFAIGSTKSLNDEDIAELYKVINSDIAEDFMENHMDRYGNIIGEDGSCLMASEVIGYIGY